MRPSIPKSRQNVTLLDYSLIIWCHLRQILYNLVTFLLGRLKNNFNKKSLKNQLLTRIELVTF